MDFMQTRNLSKVILIVVLLLFFVFGVLGYFLPIVVQLLVRNHPEEHITCYSNVKQLATAVVMYAQDNGQQFPGIDGTSWVSKIAPYVGGSARMFQCPEDKTPGDSFVSYAYGGLMLRPDGTGVKDSQIISSSEIGVIIDTAPSTTYPAGNIVGGATMQPVPLTATPAYRHKGGAVVGFADGHAKYYPAQLDLTDLCNPVTRAFYTVSPLGLADNPVGMVPDFMVAGINKARVTVGGDYSVAPILMGAVQAWMQKSPGASYYTRGFLGQDNVKERKGAWAWGIGDGKPPAGPHVAVAQDAVLVIVAKGVEDPRPAGDDERQLRARLRDDTLPLLTGLSGESHSGLQHVGRQRHAAVSAGAARRDRDGAIRAEYLDPGH